MFASNGMDDSALRENLLTSFTRSPKKFRPLANPTPRTHQREATIPQLSSTPRRQRGGHGLMGWEEGGDERRPSIITRWMKGTRRKAGMLTRKGSHLRAKM
jgi:hypothetical protein